MSPFSPRFLPKVISKFLDEIVYKALVEDHITEESIKAMKQDRKILRKLKKRAKKRNIGKRNISAYINDHAVAFNTSKVPPSQGLSRQNQGKYD